MIRAGSGLGKFPLFSQLNIPELGSKWGIKTAPFSPCAPGWPCITRVQYSLFTLLTNGSESILTSLDQCVFLQAKRALSWETKSTVYSSLK